MNTAQASLLITLCEQVIKNIHEIYDEMEKYDYTYHELDHVTKFKRHLADTMASAASSTNQADMILKALRSGLL